MPLCQHARRCAGPQHWGFASQQGSKPVELCCVAAALFERSSLQDPPKPGESFWAIYVDGSANLAGRVQEALVTTALEGKYMASEEESFFS